MSAFLCKFAATLQIYMKMADGIYINRELEATVEEASRYFPVVCVTGPRQSGKSTMLRHLFPDYVTYSLEDMDTRLYALSDPVAFLRQTDRGMFLDEVHKAPSLLSYIQGIVDNDPKRKFVLSGSANFTLSKQIAQSLAGRVGMFDLLPMSMSETANITGGKSLDSLMFDGLYPAICAGKNVPRFLYPSYVRTYLEKDVRDTLNVKDLMAFNTFLKLCAGRIGSVFNASELSNEVGVSANTISSWMSILEASYIVFMLRPYSGNTIKRLTKSPKLYFCDTGLACCLLGIETPEQLSHDKMRGHLFENLVVSEFLKKRLNNNRQNNLYFYRDSNQKEIDLLTLTSGSVNGFEIKSAMTYNPDFSKVLRMMGNYIKEPIGKRAVIYSGSMENQNADVQLLNYQHLKDVLE